MNKNFGWLILLIALNMLLELLAIYDTVIGGWITLILVVIIGIMILTVKGK